MGLGVWGLEHIEARISPVGAGVLSCSALGFYMGVDDTVFFGRVQVSP